MYWKLIVLYRRHVWNSDIDDYSYRNYRKQRDLEMWFAGVEDYGKGGCGLFYLLDRSSDCDREY